MREFKYINDYIKKLDTQSVIGDDAAVIIDENFVITKDILVESVHFPKYFDPYFLAKKSLRVSLSDLAAMGSVPRFYLLGLVLPCDISENWWKSFTQGLKEDNEFFSIQLVGGDTTSHYGPIIISVTAIGSKVNKFLLRSGSRPGDEVYVSGTLGDAALGLLAYQNIISDSNNYLKSRYNLPQPRIELGKLIAQFASSCIDISDGLLQDADHICRMSKVGMEINWEDIPKSPEADALSKKSKDLQEVILSGGDDYELLFTVPSDRKHFLDVLTDEFSFTKIGKVVHGNKIIVLDESNVEIVCKKRGFQHFL